jgi:hypothetical protein
MDKNKNEKPLIKSIKIDGSFMMKIGDTYFKMTPMENKHVTNTLTEMETVKFEDAVDFMIDNLNDRITSLESKIKALETMVSTLMDEDDNKKSNRSSKHKNDLIANCKPRELF